MTTYNVFISYKRYEKKLSNIDESVAKRLYDELEIAGFSCWMDKRDMPALTKSWQNEIVKAIDNCDFIIMVISKHAQESNTIRDHELAVIGNTNKPIIAFIIDDVELSQSFRWYLISSQWQGAKEDNYEKRIRELISKLRLELGDPTDPFIKKKDLNQYLLENNKSKEKKEEKADNTKPNTPYNKPSQKRTISVGKIKFKMVLIEGGSFIMGKDEMKEDNLRNDENNSHQVSLSDYWIGETQVTQALWESVMGNNPSYWKYEKSQANPVENVSWYDCQEFILKLNRLTGYKFRLPTEAEWEFAARGGIKSHGYSYSGSDNLEEVACIGSRTDPVASKKPNELGLYDMSGNVFEWCFDTYYHYGKEAQTNPGRSIKSSLIKNNKCICRGGSWRTTRNMCEVTYRHYFSSQEGAIYLGLRLAI